MIAAWPEGDPRWEDEQATVPYGPRRLHDLPRPAAPNTRRWPRWLLATCPLALLVGMVWWTLGRGVPSITDATTPPGQQCVPDPAAPTDSMVQVVVIDDSAPCTGTATYDRRDATLDLGGDGRYLVGAPGDLLLVGDWDCDGRATPGLYRPEDGRIFLFSSWAAEQAVTSATAEAAVPDGVPRVEHANGCDHLVVEPPA